jgi:hypothetical protein
MSNFWTVPRLWPDSTVFILGGGPSLKGMDLACLHNQRTIGPNNSFMIGDWVDVCWFSDHNPWYLDNRVRLDEFPGLKINCCNRPYERPGTQRVMRGKKMGIETDSRRVSFNKCSGSSAINLAYHLGAKRVVLLGFDMKFGKDGENNWHNYHREKPPKWNPYVGFLECFPIIKDDADRIGLEILNATPDSAIKVFPMVKLEETL